MTSLVVFESMENSLSSKWSPTNNIKKDVAQSINNSLFWFFFFNPKMKDLNYAHPMCIC